jgi:5,10-methylenetetrahydrofolate reductase
MKEAKKFGVPILAGIVVLRSAGMAKFMNKNVAGIHVPDELINEMDKAENKIEKGIEIAARLINEMKGMCQGTHIMAIGLESKVPAILDAAKL